MNELNIVIHRFVKDEDGYLLLEGTSFGIDTQIAIRKADGEYLIPVETIDKIADQGLPKLIAHLQSVSKSLDSKSFMNPKMGEA